METVYMACAAVGGTLIACQFLLTILGIGGHHDTGGGHEFGGHDLAGHDSGDHYHETAHESESNWFFSLISFRTLTATLAFFGLGGLTANHYELEPLPGLAAALFAGAVAFLIVGWLMRFLSSLNLDGTIRIDRAVGARGTVYLSIPAGKAGAGKVHVNQLNRTIEYKAITSQDSLPTGAKIVVVNIVSADTVEVAPAIELERNANV